MATSIISASLLAGRRSRCVATRLGHSSALGELVPVDNYRFVSFRTQTFVGSSRPRSCCQLLGAYKNSRWRRDAAAQPNLVYRSFGSKPSGTNVDASAESEGNHEDRSLLYSRSQSRTTFPRFLLGMTTVHTAYWLWYVLDFTPALNAAAAARASAMSAESATAAEISNMTAAASLNPIIGYAGLGLGIIMSSLAVMYPRHLISEIKRGEINGSVRIKVYDLPFVTVLKGKGELYNFGMATIDSPRDAEKIVNELNRNIAAFRGHLGVKALGSRGNLLLDVGEGDKFERKSVLLKSLLPPGKHVGKPAAAEQVAHEKDGRNGNLKRKQLKQRKARRRRQN